MEFQFIILFLLLRIHLNLQSVKSWNTNNSIILILQHFVGDDYNGKNIFEMEKVPGKNFNIFQV